jgi:hypothetical protein
VIEEALWDGVCYVREGLSGCGGALFDSSETAINVSESYGNTTLVGIDDILECSLRAAREGGDLEVMRQFTLRSGW